MIQTLPAHAPSPWLRANLLLQLAFGLLAMMICLPSLPDWATTFGASQASVQLTFSAYVATYGVLQLVYGPVSDRVGRKPVLLVGLVLALAGSLLAALAPSLGMLTFARGLQGAGSAAGMVLGRALVQDHFHGHERTRMMAYVGMTLGLCPPLATVLGGQLHVHLGWQANFVLMTVLSAIALLAAWIGLPSGKPRVAAEPATAQAHWLRVLLSSYARLAREPAYLLYVLLLCMTTSTFFVFLTGAPIVLAHYGVGPGEVGWYIMAIPVPYIVGNLFTSRLVQRWGDPRMMGLGQAAIYCGLGLMLALAWAGLRTPLSFALPLVLLGFGHGLLMPTTLAGTVGLMPALAGAASAVAGMLQQVIGAVSGYVVGWFPHDDGPANLGWLMLVLTSVGLLAQGVLFGRVLRK